MRADVSTLPLEEPARFNPGRLEELCDTMGETRAETEVAYALDRLAAHLGLLRHQADHGLADALERTLFELAGDANLIGMATLARVACDTRACLLAGDPVAFAATLARLERVGDRSIHAVWDLEDLSV